MMYVSKQVLSVVVFVGLVLIGAAQETPQPPQPPAPTHQDALAPEPHPELKPLLVELAEVAAKLVTLCSP